jgi:NTE family protein
MRRLWFDTIERIPANVRAKDPWFDEMVRHMMGARYNVIHLIYKNKRSEGHYKDYEFSSETMQHHWQTGSHDMHETLNCEDCLAMPAEGENFVTFDVHTRQRSSSGQFNYPTVKASGNRKRSRPAPK